VAKGNHTITAEATQLPGEADTLDNTMTDGIVHVSTPGDVNADKWVDMKDLYQIALAYGSGPGKPGWNPNLDVNCDNRIDMKDLYKTALNHGQHE